MIHVFVNIFSFDQQLKVELNGNNALEGTSLDKQPATFWRSSIQKTKARHNFTFITILWMLQNMFNNLSFSSWSKQTFCKIFEYHQQLLKLINILLKCSHFHFFQTFHLSIFKSFLKLKCLQDEVNIISTLICWSLNQIIKITDYGRQS